MNVKYDTYESDKLFVRVTDHENFTLIKYYLKEEHGRRLIGGYADKKKGCRRYLGDPYLHIDSSLAEKVQEAFHDFMDTRLLSVPQDRKPIIEIGMYSLSTHVVHNV